MILVCGATGTTGSDVVTQLAAAGVKMRALVRDTAQWKGSAGPMAEVRRGNFERPDTLETAMEGVDRVFLLSPPHLRQVEHQVNVIEAARRAGVEHIVKLSALLASEDSPARLLRDHGQIEKHLEQSGIAYTHLRAQYFMQNTLMFASSIGNEGAFYLPMKDAKIAMVDVRDVAAVAVAALTQGGHQGKIYEITGPEALSFSDVAQKISAAIRKPVRYVDVPLEEARKVMVAGGMPDWFADALIELLALWREGEAASVTNTVSEVARKKPNSYDDFLKDHVDSLR